MDANFPIVIVTVDDIIRFLHPLIPEVVVDEDQATGEVVIYTGKKVVSSDGHLAPLEADFL